MAETVSPKVASYIDKLTGSIQRMKATALEQKDTAIELVCAAGAAYGGSYLTERYPDRKIAGADPDAVLAVLAGGAAMMTGGTTQKVLEGVAIGASCSVAARWGAAKGQRDRAAAAAAK